MTRPTSFHHWNDGRGPRRVFVNGNEIDCVLWCDIQSGVVVFMPRPLRPMRNSDEIYTRRLRGVITVEQVGGA